MLGSTDTCALIHGIQLCTRSMISRIYRQGLTCVCVCAFDTFSVTTLHLFKKYIYLDLQFTVHPVPVRISLI